MTTGTERSIGWPGRLILGALFVIGAVVATPGGFGLLWFISYAGVGTLLVIRRPRTSIGWLLIAIGWSFAIGQSPAIGTPEQFAAGSLDPMSAGFDVLTTIAGLATPYLFIVLAIVFPSGRLPVGRWRGVTILALGLGSMALIAGVTAPTISLNLQLTKVAPVRNPAAILPDLVVWRAITPDTIALILVALLMCAVISLFVRFRRAVGVERQQMRWITAALAFVLVAIGGGLVVALLIPETAQSGVAWLGTVVAFPCIPIAIGIAVLRYRLYEIDRIISRTLSYAAVTGVLVVTFVGPVLLLQAILAPLTGYNTVAVAASTLVVAALFQPLQRRTQRVVDRRFDRARYDGQSVIDAFARQLRDEVDLDRLRTSLLATADDVVRPTSAAVWLRAEEAGR